MYGPARVRRNLYLFLALGVLAAAWGAYNLRNAPFFRYLPVVGALAPAPTPPPTRTPAPTPGIPTAEEIVALIQGYNQADIAANRNNSLSELLPFVHPEGPLYRNLSAEFRRRIASGETRNVQIRRFWAAAPSIGAEEITLDTQEVWDVVVLRNGEVVSQTVGATVRWRYVLRRDAGGAWRIWDAAALEGGYLP